MAVRRAIKTGADAAAAELLKRGMAGDKEAEAAVKQYIKKYGVALPVAAGIASGMTPQEAEASFIGAFSRGFNRAARDMAIDMEKAGKSADEIWQATGKEFGTPMYRGVDGMWRQEVTDENIGYKTEYDPLLGEDVTREFSDIGNMGYDSGFDVIDNPDLREANPTLGDVEVFKNDDTDYGGMYSPLRDRITLSGNMYGTALKTDDDVISIFAHEMQHALQQREGFAKGGNIEQSSRVLQQVDQSVKDAKEAMENASRGYETALRNRGYQETGKLAETARKLTEIDRLKSYLNDWSKGGKLTDKRRHIFNSGGSLIDHNAEYRIRMGLPWVKRHRPQYERDQNYADYISQVLAKAEEELDPKLVEQVQNSGVKNPYAKYTRELNNARSAAQEEFGVELETSRQRIKDLQYLMENYGGPGGSHRLYKDLAGEAEARLVQERLKMSMDERIETPPWRSKTFQDVPMNRQVIVDEYGVPKNLPGLDYARLREQMGYGAVAAGAAGATQADDFDPSQPSGITVGKQERDVIRPTAAQVYNDSIRQFDEYIPQDPEDFDVSRYQTGASGTEFFKRGADVLGNMARGAAADVFGVFGDLESMRNALVMGAAAYASDAPAGDIGSAALFGLTQPTARPTSDDVLKYIPRFNLSGEQSDEDIYASELMGAFGNPVNPF